ncbi:uncharacterized protein EV422DRAFT_82501 [Fimicolochytrium jonesii]|uniref:uncharacterized protein n=1 Tax=Fimicolochytrium jonesii TaxID=1396493 RepID=UPI0022FEA64A|nr:uncharacterized protein EV422DRAFT_82501 [Fimicolochytrium jonesii]KAI8820198.1 hypothetical protein EV422DRAFT_82501 [Fimicolochytrium jonesii]
MDPSDKPTATGQENKSHVPTSDAGPNYSYFTPTEYQHVVPGSYFSSSVLDMNLGVLSRSKSELQATHAFEKLGPRSASGSGPSAWKIPGSQLNVVAQSAEKSEKPNDAGSERNAPNSLFTLLQLRPNVPSTSSFAVIRLSNIAWNLGINDVVAYFAPCMIPFGHVPPHFTQAVHIIMNRSTGKTQSDCFVEFPTYTDAQRALDLHSRGILKGRIVLAQWSTQAELIDALFPHRAGRIPKGDVMEKSCDLDEPFTSEILFADPRAAAQYGASGSGLVYGSSSSQQSKEGVFLLREEINALLLVCRNYKLHFSRKCAERPFENIISIISKVPWHDPISISTAHRDHLFEMLKLSLEALRIHLNRFDHNIDDSLLDRVVRTGLCVPLFTEKQKVTLLNVAQIPCPRDLVKFVYNPPTIDGFGALEASQDCSSQGDWIQDQATPARDPHMNGSPVAVWAESCASETTLDVRTPIVKARVDNGKDTMDVKAVLFGNKKAMYPSPPEADGRMPIVGMVHTTRIGNYDNDAPDAPPGLASGNSATTSTTLQLYTSRIKMLEQALKQSETRYEDLRKRHETALKRFEVERKEIINGKLETEKRCEDLETLLRNAERRLAQMERHTSSVQASGSGASASSPVNRTEGPFRERNVNPTQGYTAAELGYYYMSDYDRRRGRGEGAEKRDNPLDSDDIRRVWRR